MGWLADRWSSRTLVIILALIGPLVGAAVLVALPGQKVADLIAIYLTYPFGTSFGILLAYNASNTAGATKKITHNVRRSFVRDVLISSGQYRL